MPEKTSDPFSTCDPLSGVEYEKAQGVVVNLRATTIPPSGQVRTVVTTAQTGSLELRYAPRDPTVSDKNTAN
jgi:hypothetical protein